MVLAEEFYSKIKSEAQKFRTKKMREIMEKENPTPEEISFLKTWAKMFKENI